MVLAAVIGCSVGEQSHRSDRCDELVEICVVQRRSELLLERPADFVCRIAAVKVRKEKRFLRTNTEVFAACCSLHHVLSVGNRLNRQVIPHGGKWFQFRGSSRHVRIVFRNKT
ncbi:MAG: hypothetical protein ACK526_08440, partial [Planctomyces sp.]